METAGFDEIADIALRKSGQSFRATQVYLMEARLANILRRESFSSLDELAACLKARPNPVLEDEVAAALTNKQSQFFKERDVLHQIVDHVLPLQAQRAGGSNNLRILCAGGGTGQEACSLAILLDEAGSDYLQGRGIEILSIDICKSSTERAREGLFNHFEIQTGLSVHRMLTHFQKTDDHWQADDALRGRVGFRVHNLLADLSGLGQFDIVLCRNVLPGMVKTIASDVLTRLSRQLGRWWTAVPVAR